MFEDLIEDYETYCINDGLLPVSRYLMRAITAGKTFQQNLDYRLYYDDASRGFSDHAYLGLYNRKAVRAIGRIVDRITADLVNCKLVNVASEIMGTPDPKHLESDIEGHTCRTIRDIMCPEAIASLSWMNSFRQNSSRTQERDHANEIL